MSKCDGSESDSKRVREGKIFNLEEASVGSRKVAEGDEGEEERSKWSGNRNPRTARTISEEEDKMKKENAPIFIFIFYF